MASQKNGNRRKRVRNPRILIVTPEITYLPKGMGNMANNLRAKAGGLADVSASLVTALFDLGADVHVALPHYRRMFHIDVGRFISHELRKYKEVLPNSRIHLAQDRAFYYRDEIYSNYHVESHKVALAFQREVINNIIPQVKPDLIHCNDWMTGLIPAAARRLDLPSLFTVHNIHTQELTLADVEESGIDAAEFWPYLFYGRMPYNYEETRDNNVIDFLASGIFSAHFVNTVSETFLDEVCNGQHDFVPNNVMSELANKKNTGCASGILNAPDPTFNPQIDQLIPFQYSSEDHVEGKQENKRQLQARLGLAKDPDAPLFFWPSRLDPLQKGPELLAHILYPVVSKYWKEKLQVVFVANGPYREAFHSIVRFHDMHKSVAVCDFDEELSHIAYAASDFTFMPSRFEPCGLPQMISAIYGSLPIAHNTGGLHDTVTHLNIGQNTGNGFIFDVYDPSGLEWAIDQAMFFHDHHADIRQKVIKRVMEESVDEFNHSVTAKNYFDIYEKMLKRPIVAPF
ncbi:glycogen synthase [bacterium B17]|nr:glycogen synthase [bacterium B17]